MKGDSAGEAESKEMEDAEEVEPLVEEEDEEGEGEGTEEGTEEGAEICLHIEVLCRRLRIWACEDPTRCARWSI